MASEAPFSVQQFLRSLRKPSFKRPLIVLTVLAGLLSAVQSSAAAINVLGSKLSEPAGKLRLNIHDPGSGVSVFRTGDGVASLPDGNYLVEDGNRHSTYGTFSVVGGSVTALTGALISSASDEIDFDLSLLARVDFDGSDLTIPANLMRIVVLWPFFQSSPSALYLPATKPGESFGVTDVSAKALFGTFIVDATLQVVVVPGPAESGEALIATANTITFDRSVLAEITIDKGDLTIPPDRLMLSANASSSNLLDDAWTFFLPQLRTIHGTNSYGIGDRQGHGAYGLYTVTSTLEFSAVTGDPYSADSLIITEVTPTVGGRAFDVSFDFTKLANVALTNEALSTPPGLVNVQLDQSFFATASNITLRVPPTNLTTVPPRRYRIQTSQGFGEYGDFTVNTDLSMTHTGALVPSATGFDFDVCQLNQLQITPASGYWVSLDWVMSSGPTSQFTVVLPNGNYTAQVSTFGSSTAHPFTLAFEDPQNTTLPQTANATFELLDCGPPDSDGDGVPDDADICPGGDDNIDTDGDLVPDDCDSCPLDADNDADGDGVCGDLDICPGADDSVDTDMDGFPDGDPDAMIFCDVCPVDPANDADDDGVCGDIDNCPLIANSNQSDADGDLLGDTCDDDDDNDGVCDAGQDGFACTAGPDNCPLDPNPDQADFDADGEGDTCDIDDDADGVVDADDSCPTTAFGALVDGTGCAIADLCPCENDWKNHGSYVKCVAHAANDFFSLGLITETEHGDIVSQAGNSDCGRR